MQKVQKLGLLVLMSTTILPLCAQDVWRSYFNVRPYPMPHVTFQNPLVQNANNVGRAVKDKNFEVFVFGSGSTEADKLAKYFFFNNLTTLTARSNAGVGIKTTNADQFAQNIQTGNFNISVANNGLATDFISTITISPHQSIFGFGIAARRHFCEYYWASIEIPVVHVRNNLKFNETVVRDGGGASGNPGFQNSIPVVNMTEAFRQTIMQFGRIDGAQKKTGVPDITLRLGVDIVDRANLYITPYIGIVLPTSNKPKAVYMFEPITGNGGHTAFILGSRAELDNRKFYDGRLWWTFYLENQYLFQNTQKRSFDLYYNGAWSRYLSVFPTAAARVGPGDATSADFGINYLTQDAKVNPGLTITLSNQVTYISKKWNIGGGLNTYVRQAEKIKLANPWVEGPMITSLRLSVISTTNPFRSIGTEIQLEDALENTFITQDQIDLGSAAHPVALSHMVYGTVGYYCPHGHPKVYEFGGSYEYSRQNTAINRWGLWGKVQVSF